MKKNVKIIGKPTGYLIGYILFGKMGNLREKHRHTVFTFDERKCGTENS